MGKNNNIDHLLTLCQPVTQNISLLVMLTVNPSNKIFSFLVLLSFLKILFLTSCSASTTLIFFLNLFLDFSFWTWLFFLSKFKDFWFWSESSLRCHPILTILRSVVPGCQPLKRDVKALTILFLPLVTWIGVWSCLALRFFCFLLFWTVS